MVGTFPRSTRQNQRQGMREAYRSALVEADLKSGKTVAKSMAAPFRQGSRDTTPAFAESPRLTDDANIKSYISTCQATRWATPFHRLLNGIITGRHGEPGHGAYDATTTGRHWHSTKTPE